MVLPLRVLEHSRGVTKERIGFFRMDNIPQDASLKQCTKCLSWFPPTTEYFYAYKHVKSGLTARCKSCISSYQKSHNQTHKSQKAERDRRYRREHKEQINQTKARYRTRRKEWYAQVCRAAGKRWRAKNPEYADRYAQDHREQQRIKTACYRKRHAERIRQYCESHKEQRRAYSRQHAKTHREYYRTRDRNRSALEKMAPGRHTVADIRKQYADQGGRCYHCQCEVGDRYHIDHVIPLARGGSNDPSNLVITCPSCNMRKHTKLPHEWGGSQNLL
jgi:hypothetical protein